MPGSAPIVLWQSPPCWGMGSTSPFCVKLESWLRMTGLAYEARVLNGLPRSSTRKIPYVELPDGRLIADSSEIIDTLTIERNVTLDAGLDGRARGLAVAVTRLLEDHFYWAIAWDRWIPKAHWEKTRVAYFGALPGPLRWLVPPLARRGIKAELRGHGMGRHGADEIHAIAARDLSAVADFLGDKAFFLDAQPRSIDAVAFAFLANVLWAPVDSPIQRHARTRPNLQAYCERMRARCFPEMPAR